jgi:NAD(P) transhydrogenase
MRTCHPVILPVAIRILALLAAPGESGRIGCMEPLFYDLIVIGLGLAGESGATAASLFGKRVAMIEKNSVVGGASANTGTLPSKTLREIALAISGLRARDLYGVDLSLRREATVADLIRSKSTASGRATRRASSDPRCIPPRKA